MLIYFRVLIHVVSEVHAAGKPKSLQTYVKVCGLGRPWTRASQYEVVALCVRVTTKFVVAIEFNMNLVMSHNNIFHDVCVNFRQKIWENKIKLSFNFLASILTKRCKVHRLPIEIGQMLFMIYSAACLPT